MTKEELGKQIETLRKECGVSTYELEQKGIHPSLPSTIEKGKKGYTIDTLINYLNAIGGGIVLSVEKKNKNLHKSQSQNNQDQQFINELQSELRWERDVVVPHLEQKLSSALTAMYDLASMLNKLEISQNEAEHVEKALQFYNENRHYKKPVVTTSNTNDDGLPF